MKISKQGIIWKIAVRGMNSWENYKYAEHSETFDSCNLLQWFAKGAFRLLMMGVIICLGMIVLLFVVPRVGAEIWGIVYNTDNYFISLLAGVGTLAAALGCVALLAYLMATAKKIKGNIVLVRETKAMFKARTGKYCTKVELTDD